MFQLRRRQTISQRLRPELPPASSTVVAATKNNQNQQDDDKQSGISHGVFPSRRWTPH
jgi:hypothetical protein